MSNDVFKIENEKYMISGKIVKKDIFCKKAQTYINNFLKKYNLRVRSLFFSDKKKLTDRYITYTLCNDNDNVAESLINFIDEIDIDKKEKKIKPVLKKENKLDLSNEDKIYEKKIYVFIGEHFKSKSKRSKSKSKKLRRKTFAVRQENDNKSNSDILSFSVVIDNYNNIKDGIYFEASCTKKDNCSSSLNYFIRVYSILELLKTYDFSFIWGCMGGDDMDKLEAMHKGRGCDINGGNNKKINDIEGRCNQYECEIKNFINIFFDKLIKQKKYDWPGC
jgi:hypothetical protein